MRIPRSPLCSRILAAGEALATRSEQNRLVGGAHFAVASDVCAGGFRYRVENPLSHLGVCRPSNARNGAETSSRN